MRKIDSIAEAAVGFEEVCQIRIDALKCKSAGGSFGEYTGELMLVCLRSGSCLIEIGGLREALDPMTIAIIPPNQFYRLMARNEMTDGIQIELPLELRAQFERRDFVAGLQFLRMADRFTCLRMEEQSHRRIARLLMLLSGYMGKERAAIYGRLVVVELLILELQSTIGEMQDELTYGDNEGAGQSQLIKGVIGYINEYYMEDIHLTTIAKKFWVSPSYLSRQFKEKLGLNISRFIMERRVYIAQKLLLITDLRITEISRRIGYKDAAYFNTVFKRVTGISPSEYRKQNDLQFLRKGRPL